MPQGGVSRLRPPVPGPWKKMVSLLAGILPPRWQRAVAATRRSLPNSGAPRLIDSARVAGFYGLRDVEGEDDQLI